MFLTESVTLNLDTYKVVKLLQNKGYSKQEAEGFIEAIQEITLNGIATKQNLDDVKNDLYREIKGINERIDSVRHKKKDISTLGIKSSSHRNEIKDAIIRLQRTMMAAVLGGVGLTVTLIKLVG